MKTNKRLHLISVCSVAVDPRANMQTERYPKPQQYYEIKKKKK